MHVRDLKFLVLVVVSVFCLPMHAVHGVDPGEVLEDATLEKRARGLSAGLRCVVCQNQSIDDSDAPLAKDLRRLVRERLKAGDSDSEVEAYIVARYGTFVLLKPPFAPNTLLLWLFPFAIVVIAIYAAYRVLFRADSEPTSEKPAPDALSEDEQQRLDALLDTRNKKQT